MGLTNAESIDLVKIVSEIGVREGRLAALREVRNWADDQMYGYDEDYNQGYDSALSMVVDHIDAMIAKEEGR